MLPRSNARNLITQYIFSQMPHGSFGVLILSIVMLYNQSPMHSINNAPKYSIIRLHVLKSEI